MGIKDIHLKKGMTKDEVNELVSEWITLEDDVLGLTIDKHNWRCKCGNLIENRAWHVIRRNDNTYCHECFKNRFKEKHRENVESSDEFLYVKSYFGGEELPNGKLVPKDRTYVEYIHKYCGTKKVSRTDFISCNECCGSYEKSLAYYIETELGEPLEKYWDYKRNKENPYHISKGMDHKIWIKCQNEEINELNGLMKKDYHGSYEIDINNFMAGVRCSYCKPGGVNPKVHPYDSFGYHNFDKVMSWHPDNDISPFRVAPNRTKEYKLICFECGNVNYRKLVNINISNTLCTYCSMSKGEKRVSDWLNMNNYEFEKEKVFDDLIGLNNGFLRYDFYLPIYNMLIEYDGEFHYEETTRGNDLIRQQMHDFLKDEYAKKNGMKLIRIPYWEFDNIERILSEEWEKMM